MNRREALKALALGAVALTASAVTPPAGVNAYVTPMITRKVPSTGEALPVIGLGTWQTFDVGATDTERAPLSEVLRTFAELGGKLVDSSPMYGRSETVVGELMTALRLRSKLFVATKVWTYGRNEGVEQMEDSLRKLRADPIDLLQVHNLVDVEIQLATLHAWKQAGRVRYVGITHYTSSAYDQVARVLETTPLDFLQINYSVREREAERRLLPLAQDRGVAVIVNRPFAQGGLLTQLRGRPLPAWAGEIECDSWAQVLLKFIISHPAVTCAIPATTKVAHLRDNLKAGYGNLPDAKLRARIAGELT